MKMQAMIKIGLIGEDPNDTSAIRNLLSKTSYKKEVRFISLVERSRGSQLDTSKFGRALAIELRTRQPQIVVFIRDADGIATETAKLEARRTWYRKHSKNITQPHLLLLNVYELEAMIFADIETFNRSYHSAISFSGDVTMKREPKEELRVKTRNLPKTYEESHCPEIFAELDFDTVQNNCGYFKTFVAALKALIT